jgi:CRISPR-associated protein Csm4
MLLRYKVRVLSPLETPLMSDTIFGHFCWGLRYMEGERFLEDFLGAFGEGRRAPVLFSSAFPAGMLPRPEIPPPERSVIVTFAREKAGSDKGRLLKALEKARMILGRSHLPLVAWQKMKAGVSWSSMLSLLWTEAADDEGTEPVEEITQSNVINRLTDSVSQEGGLFTRTRSWYPKDSVLEFYAVVNDPALLPVTEKVLTEYIPGTGFGADKSVGMGRLSVERDTSFVPSILDCPDANAWLVLSMAAFDGLERHEAYYRLKTKYGKLGGGFAAASPTGGDPRPFKKPVLMYEPGAVVVTTQALDEADLLRGVHTDGRICHCGIPLSIPFRWVREA